MHFLSGTSAINAVFS